MLLKRIFMGMAALLLASFVWRQWQSGMLQWLHPEQQQKAPEFQFDNGTVRQYQPRVSVEPLQARGGVRKCKKGDKTLYTDNPCPPNSQELPVNQGTVNVVDGAAVRHEPRAAGSEIAAAPQTDLKLRELMMERAVSGPHR